RIRPSKAMMPSTLAVTAPALTDRACSGAITVTARDSDAIPRGLAEPTTVGLSATAAGTFYTDSGCTASTTTLSMAVGTTTAPVYFKPATAGPATLTASNLDYLSTPTSLAIASVAT